MALCQMAYRPGEASWVSVTRSVSASYRILVRERSELATYLSITTRVRGLLWVIFAWRVIQVYTLREEV